MNSSTNLLNGSTWTGHSFEQALQERPQLSLHFYSYGILLQKQLREGGYHEYAVDAKQVAQTLAAKLEFSTGLIQEDLLFLHRKGLEELLISYRRGQKTGIWLEGSSEPLRLALPPLLLIRSTKGQGFKHYLFAVKQRPQNFRTMLYHAPLPNLYGDGSICWGNVRLQPNASESHLQDDWQALLGSPFGNHSVHGKSRSHDKDIREKLLALSESQARVYPKADLISKELRLGDFLAKVGYHVR